MYYWNRERIYPMLPFSEHCFTGFRSNKYTSSSPSTELLLLKILVTWSDDKIKERSYSRRHFQQAVLVGVVECCFISVTSFIYQTIWWILIRCVPCYSDCLVLLKAWSSFFLYQDNNDICKKHDDYWDCECPKEYANET